MWTNHFRVVKIVPGRVVTHSHGTIDFSKPNLDPKVLLELYESGFQYIDLTPEGLEYYYGVNQSAPNNDLSSAENEIVDRLDMENGDDTQNNLILADTENKNHDADVFNQIKETTSFEKRSRSSSQRQRKKKPS